MDNKNYGKILKLIIYVYIFIMIFISFLLMFNNIINIIFYSYYKYNDKFILNDKEKLYVYETYTYKLFISMLKDNLENYNNLYFTQNTSSNLLKIFIIFTIVFFWLFIISDTYISILSIKEKDAEQITMAAIIIAILTIIFSIYYSLLFIINYIDLLIISVCLWIFVIIAAAFVIIFNKKKDNTKLNLISIIFLFITFFEPDNESEDEKFKEIFYYTILIFVFIIYVLLILSFTIFEGKKTTTISYEKYCFDICNDNNYNSLENYFHNKYFKNLDEHFIVKIQQKLEEHNIYTINKIIKFIDQGITSDGNGYNKLDDFIDEIKDLSNILNSKEYNYDKYDKLDFIKLVNIFINNELIYRDRTYGLSHVNENDLHKDFNYLFNMNENIVNKETYNIENVLIAAFPVKYINKHVKIID